MPREGHRVDVDRHRGKVLVEREVVLHDAGGHLIGPCHGLVARAGDVVAFGGRDGHVDGGAGLDREDGGAVVAGRADKGDAVGRGRDGRVGDGGHGERDGVAVPGRPVGDGARGAGGNAVHDDVRAEVVRPAVERVTFAAGGQERDREVRGDVVGCRVRDGVRRAGEAEHVLDRVLEEADGVGRDGALRFREDRVARARGSDDGRGLGEGALRGVDLDGLAGGEGDRAGNVVREEVEGPDAGLVGGGEAVGRGGVGHVAHGGHERDVVFGDDGGLHAVGVGEADAVDLLGLVGPERLHRDRVRVRARARARASLVERNAFDVVAGGGGLDVEDDQEVVRRVGGGIDAGELDPSVHALRIVARVGVERGSLVARELRDREAGAGLADAVRIGQRIHRSIGNLDAGLDADHLAGGGRGQFLVDALHALGEIGHGVELVRRDIEPLGLALRVEAAGQVGGALGGERPVDGLVPGQGRKGGGRAVHIDGDARGRGLAGHFRRGIDRRADNGARLRVREGGRPERGLGEGERRGGDGLGNRERNGLGHASRVVAARRDSRLDKIRAGLARLRGGPALTIVRGVGVGHLAVAGIPGNGRSFRRVAVGPAVKRDNRGDRHPGDRERVLGRVAVVVRRRGNRRHHAVGANVRRLRRAERRLAGEVFEGHLARTRVAGDLRVRRRRAEHPVRHRHSRVDVSLRNREGRLCAPGSIIARCGDRRHDAVATRVRRLRRAQRRLASVVRVGHRAIAIVARQNRVGGLATVRPASHRHGQ